MASKIIETDAKGIPLKGPDPGLPFPVFYAVGNTIFGAIGFGVAWFWAYSASKQEVADAKMALVNQYDLGWLYLGILLLKTLQIPLYAMLGVTRGACKVHVPDQHVYKVKGAAGSNLGYVLMDTEGVNGDFNRAQRALHNYCEAFPTVLALYIAASWVFPFEAFVCAVVWAASRIMSASGYKSYADGRMSGMLIGVVALSILQGMIIIVAIKTLMY
eukprot:CAMPEP_0119010512 /NCGR_PEP_ID=MMETSP1176-20130426/5061_1 /TAXON_ID=265551 /ORGANISM="Synedropsis recta cf, Strain CCMP1620" /LENGTH=215 /DNA_ID=CAMNT_0006963185 /DNA_START=67 /DNA_END=714 /DNA_ORIENTATION=-